MPDQPKNPQQSSAVPPKINPEPKPAIRTMKSDVEALFKTTRPSLIEIISKEASVPMPRPFLKGKKMFSNRGLTIGVAMLFIAVGIIIFFLNQSQKEKLKPKLVPPAPFFATETARTVSVRSNDRALFLRLIEDSVREREREGTIKRVIVKLQDGPQERFATVSDFFEFYRIETPSGFLNYTEAALMPFIYYGRDGARFGLSLRTTDPNRALRDMLLWEPSFLRDLAPLFFDEKPEVVIAPFEDRTYRNIDWRFLKLSQTQDLGIAYTIFPAGNIVAITTSKESMETVINRLFDAR